MPSPNADSASASASATSPATSPRVRTTRMPRPPPPAEALTSTGRSVSLTAEGASPVRTGTPAASMSFLAAIFEPMASMDRGSGPIQVSPASITARAKAAFSERKP